MFWFVLSQAALFGFGIWFLGLRLRAEMVLAFPAVLLAVVAMVGIAYLLAAIVLLDPRREFLRRHDAVRRSG